MKLTLMIVPDHLQFTVPILGSVKETTDTLFNFPPPLREIKKKYLFVLSLEIYYLFFYIKIHIITKRIKTLEKRIRL